MNAPSERYFNYQLNLPANAGKSRDEVWELTCQAWARTQGKK